MKQEMEELIAGGSIEKPVHEDITYDEVYKTEDNLWNFLFFTGYLKKLSERFDGEMVYLTLAVPNTGTPEYGGKTDLPEYHFRLV